MYRLEPYEKELRSTTQGRAILQVITMHMGEVNRLINKNREVTVTWQRNKGPLFFSRFMASGFDATAIVPATIEGSDLLSLIRRMAVVLQDHGSADLAGVIDRYLLFVLDCAASCQSLYQLFQKLRENG